MAQDKEADPESGTSLGYACARCQMTAKLQCPKCLELGLPKQPSVFCSQDCFKTAWADHKHAHKPGPHTWAFVTQRGRGRSFTMPSFSWTSPLRPERVSPRREVPADIPRPDYAETGQPLSEIESRQQSIVLVRSADEIKGIREACLIGRRILDAAHAAVRPGVTTDEIDRVVHEATIAEGAYPSPLNYCNFPKSVCTSVNEVVCHGIPDQRPLKDGDIINVDVSAYYKGFHGDLNETFVVGSVDGDSKKLIRVTAEALDKAIEAVRPGLRYREIGDIISQYVGAHKFQVVRSYCGHGIGDLFHCAPNIPHYSHNKAVGVMKEGQVFTIEPMVNAGTYRDVTWPDGWTAVTADGKRSAQFEHTLLVTKDGCEILTARLPTSPPLWWQK
ncbi:g3575 [Coccomyxa elongata]